MGKVQAQDRHDAWDQAYGNVMAFLKEPAAMTDNDRQRDAQYIAQYIANILVNLSDVAEPIEVLALTLGELLGPANIRKLRAELKLYEVSEEEEKAEREKSQSMKDLWLREHPGRAFPEVWVGDELSQAWERWEQSRKLKLRKNQTRRRTLTTSPHADEGAVRCRIGYERHRRQDIAHAHTRQLPKPIPVPPYCTKNPTRPRSHLRSPPPCRSEKQPSQQQRRDFLGQAQTRAQQQ